MPLTGPPFVGLGEAPRVVSCTAETRTRLRVVFSEAMRVDAPFLDPTSYTLTPDGGSVSRAILTVSPAARVGPTSVVLTLSGPLTEGASNYNIAVDTDVEDMAGNGLDATADSVDFSVASDTGAAPGAARRLVVLVRIEAIGTGGSTSVGAQFTWCSRRPRSYADWNTPGVSAATYIPDLCDWPSAIEQRSSPLGGVAESGELSVVILDGGARGDRLTQLLAIHRRAINFLVGPVGRTDTSVTFAAPGSLSVGDVVHAGGEAMRLASNTSGNTWTVTRGVLDTDAQRHTAGAPVLAGTALLHGRRMRLFVGQNDGAHASTDEEEIEAGWAIDSIDLTPDLGAWILRGRSQLKHLDRLLDRRPFQASLVAFDDAHAHVTLQPVRSDSGEYTAYRGHFNDRTFIRIGDDEIRQIGPGGAVDRIPRAGTLAGDWREGDGTRQVFVAQSDQTGTDYGSFRGQAPGSETDSRSTGAWVPYSHAIPILLCLITGKSDLEDNVPDNYTPGFGNWSGLPPGVGLGTPAREIDFGSALDVWHRAPHLVLEHFVLDATESGREVLDRILRLTGIEIHTANGLLTFRYVRTPLADDVVAEWGPAQIVARDDGSGNIIPEVNARLDASLAIGAVKFTALNARGDDVELVYSDADFPEVFGDVRGLYSIDEKPLPIDARYVRCEDAGGEPELLRQRALQILRAYRRIPWRYGFATPREQRAVQSGDFVRFTYPQIPDLVNGQRGIVRQTIKILSKREVVNREKVEIAWDAISYPAAKAGRIAPAARISGPAVGNTIPVTANRYTDPNARGDLPRTDAAGFSVGDRVCLKTRGALRIVTTPAYETVVSVGTNELELSGDFGGASEVTAGTVIAFVRHDEATDAQRARFVFMASRTTRQIGSSGEQAWTYGEG